MISLSEADQISWRFAAMHINLYRRVKITNFTRKKSHSNPIRNHHFGIFWLVNSHWNSISPCGRSRRCRGRSYWNGWNCWSYHWSLCRWSLSSRIPMTIYDTSMVSHPLKQPRVYKSSLDFLLIDVVKQYYYHPIFDGLYHLFMMTG